MTTPEATTAKPSRRRLIIAIAAVVVLVLAGGGYYGYRAYTAAQPGNVNTPSPLGDIALGPADARVTIIEYASMTCPHCAAFSVQTFPKLKEKYIDTGKVKYIMREYPLDGLAAAAFMLARCGGPDKYYPLIETLFAQQQKWAVREPIPPLLAIAKQAGFTQQSFEACLANQKVLEGIEWVRNRATEKFKVDATPTFFINGEMHRGEMSLDEMEKAIQPYLKA